MCILLPGFPFGTPPVRQRGIETLRGRRMFFFYFNKLGWPGSILLSIVLTGLLFLAIRAFNG
jgi:hypothetical protein